jgi:hypothetical protein
MVINGYAMLLFWPQAFVKIAQAVSSRPVSFTIQLLVVSSSVVTLSPDLKRRLFGEWHISWWTVKWLWLHQLHDELSFHDLSTLATGPYTPVVWWMTHFIMSCQMATATSVSNGSTDLNPKERTCYTLANRCWVMGHGCDYVYFIRCRMWFLLHTLMNSHCFKTV